MKFFDPLIKTREVLLDWILGVRPSNILNPESNADNISLDGSNLAGEIKRSINQFKAAAMDEGGYEVNYHILSESAAFKKYAELISLLRDFDYLTLTGHQEKLAFWINLYNTLVIDAVVQENVQNSVIETPLGILSFFQKAAYMVNGQRFSLSDIEHGILRGNRGFPYLPGPHFSTQDPRFTAVITAVDPRIHFALNCASKSCPPIGVYSPEDLESQLDLATRNFIQNDLVLNMNQNTITVSKIFRWYQVDFGGNTSLLHFLTSYLDDLDSKAWLENNLDSIRINHHPYDWRLNQLTQ